MGISSKIGLVHTRTTPASMRAFIVCLAIATVSGDAQPYTLAQVAAGLPVQNAAADGRLHNIGVITNAGAAGVKTVGALAYTAPVHTYIPGFYGKREAEPYTLAQVAAGQTNGGVITGISYGHGTGLVPAVGVSHVAYHGYPYRHYFYGKRDAEPYTLGQVYHGQTAGGVVTGVDYGHGSGLVPATGVTHTVPYVYAGYPFHYFG